LAERGVLSDEGVVVAGDDELAVEACLGLDLDLRRVEHRVALRCYTLWSLTPDPGSS
jgi:hypothetical protein